MQPELKPGKTAPNLLFTLFGLPQTTPKIKPSTPFETLQLSIEKDINTIPKTQLDTRAESYKNLYQPRVLTIKGRSASPRVFQLIRVIAQCPTLTSINLITEEPITDEIAIMLAEMLKHNTTIATLNVVKSELTDCSMIPIIEALKTNRTLLRLTLDQRVTIDRAFIDTAKKSEELLYTQLGVPIFTQIKRLEELVSYLERNSKIKDGLERATQDIFEPYNQTGKLDKDAVQTLLATLEQLVPDLIGDEEVLPADHRIVETHRLLTGFAYLSTEGHYCTSDILACLIPNFKDPKLQAIADQALGRFLFLSDLFKEASLTVQMLRYQYILYSLRGRLDQPDAQNAAYHALASLYKGKVADINASGRRHNYLILLTSVKI